MVQLGIVIVSRPAPLDRFYLCCRRLDSIETAARNSGGLGAAASDTLGLLRRLGGLYCGWPRTLLETRMLSEGRRRECGVRTSCGE
jgi:hypothetical protein